MFKKLVVVGTVCAAFTAAQQPSWGIEQGIMGALGNSVSFVDANRGYYPMTTNGQGSTVLETVDGGQNWNASGNINVMMFLGSDAKGDKIVASSLFGAVYSTDAGKTWNTGDTLSGGQSVRFSDTMVWIPINYQIQSSSDGGRFWTSHKIPELQTPARYVAAPTDNIVYVTAGQWPQQSAQNDAKAYPFSARWTLSPHAVGGKVSAIPTLGALNSKHAEATGQFTQYQMQIVKSTDGGATWTTQFYNNGSLNLYFNSIDCYDAEHCCAAAEGNSVAVYCTNDGQNWNQVWSDPSTYLSLTSAAYVGPNEIWIGGGFLGQLETYAYFLHSVDGGKTWSVEGTDNYGQYPNDLSFISNTRGWASTFNSVQQSGLMEFKVWTSSSSAEKTFLQ